MTCPGCNIEFTDDDDGWCLYVGHLCQREPLNAPCKHCGELTDYRSGEVCKYCQEDAEREYHQGELEEDVLF